MCSVCHSKRILFKSYVWKERDVKGDTYFSRRRYLYMAYYIVLLIFFFKVFEMAQFV